LLYVFVHIGALTYNFMKSISLPLLLESRDGYKLSIFKKKGIDLIIFKVKNFTEQMVRIEGQMRVSFRHETIR